MSANVNAVSATDKIMQSRAELEKLLIDEPRTHQSSGVFPRSKTLRLLTSNRGVVLLAIAAGGLMLLRPTMAKRAVRLVPMGAMLRMLAARFLRNDSK